MDDDYQQIESCQAGRLAVSSDDPNDEKSYKYEGGEDDPESASTDHYLNMHRIDSDEQPDRQPRGNLTDRFSCGHSTNKDSFGLTQKRRGPLDCYMITPYMDEEQRRNARAYKYSGQDEQILYRYLFNPLASYLVEFVPRWVAPNVITMAGFLLCVLPFFYVYSHGSTFLDEEERKIPREFYLAQAVCYFLYRLLDEMDGKQARRTGNSSSLGLLFDHGVDAFCIGLQTTLWLKCAQVGHAIWVVLPLATILMVFHVITLEEYYTNHMYLGPGNFVSDGLPFMLLMYICMYLFGNEFWQTVIFERFGLRLSEYLGVYAVISQLTVVTYTIYCIFKHKRDVKPGQLTGEKLVLREFIRQIIGYLLMLVATTSLGFMGKNPISQMEIKAGDSNPIFYLICLQNMLMQHLSCSIMLCHVTKKKYSPFNNKLLLFILVAIFAIYCLDKLSDGNLNMPYCIYTLLAATLVCQCHFIVVLIQEMCDALGIKAFQGKKQETLVAAK